MYYLYSASLFMGEVNFYLKKKEPVTGKSLIYLQFKYGGNKLTYTFNQTIDPKNWNKSKQRVKNNTQTTADGQHSLNDLLDNLELVLKRAYHAELKNGLPQPALLKRHLINFINQNEKSDTAPTFFKLMDRFISGEIKYKGKEKSPNTIKTYNTLVGHLKAFELVKKYPIDYDSINLDFLYKYISFLNSPYTGSTAGIQDKKTLDTLKRLPVGQNAIAKDVQILKTVLKKAVTLGETKNAWHAHEDFTAVREETDAVYLTEKEIIDLYHYDLSHSKRLEQTRDLFVFGCFVGLRYSDYSNIKPSNIVTVDGELFIKMITQKTGEHVIIPCNPVVLEIFEKYKDNPNRLPRTISSQKFNEAIKEACELAGLIETGRLTTEPDLELYKCISSHTARRSFASNYYLQGFPVIDLMKITGHRTEKAFLKYIRVTKLDAAKRLSAHIKLRWSEKILKAVG